SALDEAKILEDMGFYDIVLSLKASDVMTMIEAYTLASEKCDYPLHLVVTDAGLAYQGSIKSAVGIGSLLSRGIGDTIRVSLTADVEEEVRAAKEILASLNLRQKPYNLVSCPTCGRTEIDLVGLAREVSRRLDKNPPKRPITVAVMGCVVNGPGEASMADVGIAGGKGCGLVFKKGEIIDKVPEDKLVDALMEVIESGDKKAAKAETTGVVIRKAKVDDIPDIQRIINSFAAKDEMLPRSLNALYEDIRDFYVLEENGKIVGCCALHICWSDLAEIQSLAVTEEAQGKGYGKLITERCIENAKEMGVPRVFALTYVDGFFKRLGFGKIENSKLPQKIWSDCINCPKFPDCNEIAVVKDLTEEVNK
ncbi:MAG: N-acetyltransferase, partial [Abditibacteriota bacterium]|nr:N-acetyltransferase [Abditibacteriota bacterium]